MIHNYDGSLHYPRYTKFLFRDLSTQPAVSFTALTCYTLTFNQPPSTMDRHSLEARSRKSQPKSMAVAGAPAKKAVASNVNLRPASPPKTNPWARNQVFTTDNREFPAFPSLPPPQSNEVKSPDTGKSQISSPGLSSPKEKCPTDSVHSERSMSVSSDAARHVFEAAAPKALEKCGLPLSFVRR